MRRSLAYISRRSLLPMIAIFCHTLDYYQTWTSFMAYCFFVSTQAIVLQSAGRMAAMVFPNDQKLSLLCVVAFIHFLLISSNLHTSEVNHAQCRAAQDGLLPTARE